jgi:hypothetical protein
MYALNLQTKEWKEIKAQGEIPFPRINLCSAVYNGEMYIFAGHSGSNSSNDIFKFHFGTLNIMSITDWL